MRTLSHFWFYFSFRRNFMNVVGRVYSLKFLYFLSENNIVFCFMTVFLVRKLTMIFLHVFFPIYLFSCFMLPLWLPSSAFLVDANKCVAISHCMKETLSAFFKVKSDLSFTHGMLKKRSNGILLLSPSTDFGFIKTKTWNGQIAVHYRYEKSTMRVYART